MKILEWFIYLTHSGDERSIKQRTGPEDLFGAQASSGSLQKHCTACFLLRRKDRSPTSRPVLPPGKRQRRSRSVQLFLGGRPEQVASDNEVASIQRELLTRGPEERHCLQKYRHTFF